MEKFEQEFQDLLEELYGSAFICGQTYSAGFALKLVDEAQYKEMFADYLDTIGQLK